jgi:hypothetical protein
VSDRIDRSDGDEAVQADALHRLIIEGNPICWLDQYGVIHTKKVNPHPGEFQGTKLWKFDANPLQNRLGEIVDYMLRHKLPVRILIYKPRQKGSSTGSMGIADWFIKKFGHNAYLCGNSRRNCGDLFEILRTYNAYDTYDWGITTDVQSQLAVYSNGARFQQSVAKDMEAGRGAALGVLVMTEIARWAEGEGGKVINAGKVFSSLMGCVADEPNTLVIGETTVRGGSGVFFEQWQAAKTFEQLKAGDYKWGDFIKVFMPWYVFDDSYLPTTPEEDSRILAGEDAMNEEERVRERELLRRYKLKPGHIKYFRARLKKCDFDPEERDREEPTTEESGFFAAQPCYFNKTNLRHLQDAALRTKEAHEIKPVILAWDDPEKRRGVAVEPCTMEDRPLWGIKDRPEMGQRYIIGADNSRGIAPKKGEKETDCHAVVVMREEYIDRETGIWHAPKVVMSLNPKVRIDIDLLAEEIAKASKLYGNCLVVPEANNDCGLIMCLRRLGVPVYERQKPATEQDDQEGTGKFGVWTSDDGAGRGFRSQFLGDLQSAVRKLRMEGHGIEIPFGHILDEMEHFATNTDTGKTAAVDGWHDDFVMALAFAYYFRSRGTIYSPAALAPMMPPDVRKMHDMVRSQGGRGSGAWRV